VISDLLRSVLACLLLLSGGVGIALIIRAGRSWRWSTLVGLGWNLGLGILYLTGNVLARWSLLRGIWPLCIGGICLVLGVTAFANTRTRPKWESHESWKAGNLKTVLVGFCLAFLLFKAILTFSILIQMPVIDSDAANPDRWVGLAKEIAFQGMISPTASNSMERLSPSLVPAFISGFTSRWRDNLVCLPWFFTWLSILALVWGTLSSIVKNTSLAAGVTLLFASVPLSIVHVVRPGFSDLLAAGLLVGAMSAFLLTMFRQSDFSIRSWLLLLLLLLGAVLTKKEAGIWVLWMLVTAFCFDLNQRRHIGWRKIAIGLCLAGGVGAAGYALLHDWIRTVLIADSRVGWLFEINYSDRAVWMFFKTLLASNGFNLLYWIFFGLSLGLLVRIRKARLRSLLIFGLLPFLFLFYFCCFTGAVPYTESGTGLGRWLLQVQGFTLPALVIASETYRASKELPAKKTTPARSKRSRGKH
jgi:hypothetical protein